MTKIHQKILADPSIIELETVTMAPTLIAGTIMSKMKPIGFKTFAESSFPLYRSRRLAGDVIDHPGHPFHLVHDPLGDLLQEFAGQAGQRAVMKSTVSTARSATT